MEYELNNKRQRHSQPNHVVKTDFMFIKFPLVRFRHGWLRIVGFGWVLDGPEFAPRNRVLLNVYTKYSST